MPLIERLERDKGETRKREERTIDRLEKDQQETRYRAMTDGLSQTNKIAREIQRESQRDLERAREIQRELERARESYRELQRAREGQRELEQERRAIYTTCLQTDRQTDGWTLLVHKVAIATENTER